MSPERIYDEVAYRTVAVPTSLIARPTDGFFSNKGPSPASEAAAFLKAIGHEGRLMILCHLAARERSVTELEALLGARQAAVSQHLARLRLEGLVTTRRDGKSIIYAIRDPKALRQLWLLGELFGVA